MKTTIKTKTKRISTVLACAGLVALANAPGAQAKPDDPFTPSLSTGLSTTQAGAHPDLEIGTHKTPNYCPPADERVLYCDLEETPTLYIEQDVKKIEVHLPPGLLPDANAAPYCDAFAVREPGKSGELWKCANPESAVGFVTINARGCGPDTRVGRAVCWFLFSDFDFPPFYPCPPPGGFLCGTGVVYNERPEPGEQGHLVVLWMGLPDDPGLFGNWIKSDVSVRVRESDLGVDTVADDIPDFMYLGIGGSPTGGQAYDIVFTLLGETGADNGHPLITNPTSCEPKALDALFQGYEFNSVDVPHGDDPVPGHGDGKVVTDSAPYQATDCDAVPYAPTFTATADSEAPGATPALSTVITQADDEATTKKVQVTFPKGMGVNINSSLTPCSAPDLAAESCPEASKMGTVTAESRLLPKRAILGDSVKPEDEVLVGNAYLTGLKGNELSLSLLLKGFIDLRLDATAGVSADGTLTATFNDLPSLPYNRFTLNLFGGERSLLQNPRRCGTQKTTATFTSHSGKVHTTESASEIKGCSKPTFDVELTEPGKGKRTGLNLEVRSDEKPIKEVKFGIDRYMKLSTRGLGKKRKFGEVSATSTAGTEEAALKRPVGVKQKKGKAFSLRTSALKGLGVNIYRKRFTRKGIKTFKRAKNKKKKILKKKTVPKNRVSVKQLPRDDLTKVAVSLNPDETKLLRNPTDGKTCHARFLAIVKTEDGTKYALKQKLRLRGKGCGKKKSKKQKK